MNGLAGAVSLLTRIPVRGSHDPAQSVKWFPVVGLFVGVIAGTAYWGVGAGRAPAFAAVVAVAVAVGVTGAFHEDGLADTFDGLSVTRSVERQLAIMGDSRLGVFGACALVLVLAARVLLVAGLTPDWTAVPTLAWVHGVSRAAVIGVMTGARPAGGGMGSAHLAGFRTFPAVIMAGAVAAVGWWLVGARLPWALAATAVGPLLVWGWAHRRIGGVTGDVLGACQQVALVGALVAVTA